jgi:predicted nicotinamide N-methyase
MLALVRKKTTLSHLVAVALDDLCVCMCVSLSSLSFHAVMWPSAVVLSGWLVTEPSSLLGCHEDGSTRASVLELGAGCGLTGLVAARLLQQQSSSHKQLDASVLLTDFNPTVLENLKRNVALNDFSSVCSVVGLDFYQQTGSADHWKDMNGQSRAPVDVVLAADIICQPSDAVAAANTIHDVLKPGGTAHIVCADAAHRFGVDHLANECHRVGLTVSIRDAREVYDRVLLGQHLDQTTGYVEGMSLTLFTVRKALQ